MSWFRRKLKPKPALPATMRAQLDRAARAHQRAEQHALDSETIADVHDERSRRKLPLR